MVISSEATWSQICDAAEMGTDPQKRKDQCAFYYWGGGDIENRQHKETLGTAKMLLLITHRRLCGKRRAPKTALWETPFIAPLDHAQKYACTEVCIHRSTHAQKYACTEVCMHRSMHAQKYAFTEVCMHRSMHAQKYACTVVRMHRSMHALLCVVQA